MANRDALKELTKRFPGPPELAELFDSLGDQPDRSAAIVATTIVEAVLQRLITTKLKHQDANLIGMLFNNRGPMSDFHGKIVVAHAMGIIQPDMAADLHLMKAIRNVFAHALVPVTFQTPEIAAKMDEITMFSEIQKISRELRGIAESLPRSGPQIGKRFFILYARIHCMIMDVYHQLGGGDYMLGNFLKEQPSASDDKSP